MSNQDKNRAGHFVQQTSDYKSFIPAPLPPEPPLKLDGQLHVLLSEADRAIGRLDSIVELIPNPDLFIGLFSRNEAVHSSRIEGTQTSLSELLLFEMESNNRPVNINQAEVYNYVKALNYGLERLSQLPLSLRLIREIHEILLEGGRGSDKTPGEFRKVQVHIGPPGSTVRNATYIPPPPNEVINTLNDLEKFIHKDSDIPILIKCGLIHAQFEMIHPFLDGNGRIGRLLITFMLCWSKVMKKPLLYISDYFNRHRDDYYTRLRAVSNDGDWEGWIEYFLTAVQSVAIKASQTGHNILFLREKHRQLIIEEIPKSTVLLNLLDNLFLSPVIDLNRAIGITGKSKSTVISVLNKLVDLGILVETTEQARNRIYLYKSYVDLFD
ncbi:MAG: Fic family protein [bacterium]|nr:Fic family protein [bacterium]